MLGFFSEKRKDLSQVGKRIKLIFMEDVDPIPPNTTGVIVGVDDAGYYQVNWENGRSLSIIPQEDQFEFIENEGIKQ